MFPIIIAVLSMIHVKKRASEMDLLIIIVFLITVPAQIIKLQ